MNRILAKKKSVNTVTGRVIQSVHNRISKKGSGVFVSPHESLGIIAEEYHELIEAVRSNNNKRMADEAIDIAVGCIWMVISLLEQKKIYETDTGYRKS